MKIGKPARLAYRWIRRHPLATAVAAAALYYVPFHIYYLSIEGWTHPADWWFHLAENDKATWVAAVAGGLVVWSTLLAIRTAIASPHIEAKLRRNEAKHAADLRALAMTTRLQLACNTLQRRLLEIGRQIGLAAIATRPEQIRKEMSALNLVMPGAFSAALQEPEILGITCMIRLARLSGAAYDLDVAAERDRKMLANMHDLELTILLSGDDPRNAIRRRFNTSAELIDLVANLGHELKEAVNERQQICNDNLSEAEMTEQADAGSVDP